MSNDHQRIATLSDRMYVEGVYSLVNPQLGQTRTNKPFLKCVIRDASGEITARAWSFEEAQFEQIAGAGFVFLRGSTQAYQGQLQLIIEQIEPREVTAEEMLALLPSTSKDIGAMFGRVCELLRSMEHPAMRALAEQYLSDERLMEDFRQAPAAMSVHHGWIGGLLEHTHQLMELADRMLPLYPGLNRDLVLFSLFIHDLGKTVELSWDQGFQYTNEGQLIGHIVRGAVWLQVKAAQASRAEPDAKLPGDTLRVLQHILISHHGVPEHGAAKVPATPEAVFVAMLDNLDAKAQAALSAAKREFAGGGEWTDRVFALDTKLYRPDPLM
ncbi:MAG: 3-5 exoribonuclease YhaM [Planctomycetota bacterium]|jgi:3'-5' exoribonuclease